MSLRLVIRACLCFAWTSASLGSPLTGNALGFDVTDETTALFQVGSRVAEPSNWPRKRGLGIPELFVDLDIAPELRWSNVTRYYKERGIFPDALLKVEMPDHYSIKALLKRAITDIDAEYRREMEGMVADINDPRLTVERLIFLNLGYELNGKLESDGGILFRSFNPGSLPSDENDTGCSGLLVAMTNGTVVHGRNMDYKGFEFTVNGKTLYYPQVTVDVTFLKAGKPFITSVNWPGSVGIHTAIRYNGWTFEQNTRLAGVEANIVAGLAEGSEGFMLRARRIMETVPDFETAVHELYNANFMAPQYFIVAGPEPYQGAVITIDRAGKHLEESPPVQRLSQASPVAGGGRALARWHLYQSNDDKGGVPVDMRRIIEESRLRVSPRKSVDIDWVFDELNTEPVFNHLTVFTTVYVPATGYHTTYVHPKSHR